MSSNNWNAYCAQQQQRDKQSQATIGFVARSYTYDPNFNYQGNNLMDSLNRDNRAFNRSITNNNNNKNTGGTSTMWINPNYKK